MPIPGGVLLAAFKIPVVLVRSGLTKPPCVPHLKVPFRPLGAASVPRVAVAPSAKLTAVKPELAPPWGAWGRRGEGEARDGKVCVCWRELLGPGMSRVTSSAGSA